MSSEYDWLRQAHGLDGDTNALFELARRLEEAGDLHAAATAYDRAFGLSPSNGEIAAARQNLLERLAVNEHGLRFVYIPAGTFLMGSETGDPDERPVHPVELGHFWLSETPVSWAIFCAVAGWEAPPSGIPTGYDWKKHKMGDPLWALPAINRIRLQYCENETTRALDWHAHAPPQDWKQADGRVINSRKMFGEPPRENPDLPYRYDAKPVVGIPRVTIDFVCQKIATADASYRLPTEAEWEKGARGGLINQPYPWGNELPSSTNCDFGRFDQFAIQPMRRFPPNAYGLYAMVGGVWEYVSDWYDAQYYAESPRLSPTGPSDGTERVLRGGSWSDCAEVQTVSYRLSRKPEVSGTPNFGFRLCRTEKESSAAPSKTGWLRRLISRSKSS